MGAISILMLPATLAIMPWYASLVLGNWWLLALIWGGVSVVLLVGLIGSDMAKD